MIREMKSNRKPSLPKMIGVIHLPALPGAPESAHLHPALALQEAGLWAVQEAKQLAKAGFDGIILENFGDAPFYKTEVKPETVAAMSVIAAAVRESTRLPIGINVLRNDAFSALSIAAVTGCDFIRVNVLSGVTATDQGLIEGKAADLIRERIRLNAQSVLILADVHVKHAKSLSSSNLAIAIEETAGRGGADGIIISGDTTGRAPDLTVIQEAIEAGKHLGVPVYLGSGATPALMPTFPSALRIIVGSTLRKNGVPGAPLDAKRIKGFMDAVKKTKTKGKGKSGKNGKTRRTTA
jgi:membrane complex biogenesis BtpA family protein